MKDSEKEGTKLLATALNTLGINIAVVVTIVPIAGYLYKLPSAPSVERLFPAIVVGPVMFILLHVIARFALKDLDQ